MTLNNKNISGVIADIEKSIKDVFKVETSVFEKLDSATESPFTTELNLSLGNCQCT